MQAFELAGIGCVEEGAGLHDVDLSFDADFLELGLDVLGYDAGLGQVAAHHVAIGDLGLEDAVCIVDALFGQDLLGHFGVVLVPVLSLAVAKDAGRHELGGDDRAGRVEVVDDAVAIDRHREGLAHLLVVERREGIVHADVEDVGAGARVEGQRVVALDHFEVIRDQGCRCR